MLLAKSVATSSLLSAEVAGSDSSAVLFDGIGFDKICGVLVVQTKELPSGLHTFVL